jgi:hypothetical protein
MSYLVLVIFESQEAEGGAAVAYAVGCSAEGAAGEYILDMVWLSRLRRHGYRQAHPVNPMHSRHVWHVVWLEAADVECVEQE